MSSKFPLLFLTGPTASGKTAVAVETALRYNAEIINADAYQVYRELPLLTAAPSEEERSKVPHHLVGFLSVTENWDATLHYKHAMECIREVQSRGKTALIVGGSGLYVKFLSHGIPEAPPASEELRKEWEEVPLEELAGRLAELDPEGAAATNLQNRRYVTRNLEIVVLGGKPLSYWRNNWIKEPAGPGFYLDWETEELDARIRRRSEWLMEEGAVEEVMALPPCAELSDTARKTLGLSLIQQYLGGEIDRETCRDLLALRTRQYAKRQRTWLRRETWLSPLSCREGRKGEEIAGELLSYLGEHTLNH